MKALFELDDFLYDIGMHFLLDSAASLPGLRRNDGKLVLSIEHIKVDSTEYRYILY